MKKFKFSIRGTEFNVEVLKVDGNQVQVEVNGTRYDVDLHKEIKTTKTPIIVRTEPEITEKEKRIVKTVTKTTNVAVRAPLPGTILKVLVNVGDEVKIGQQLLTMEAMKMENNVLAEKSGTVRAVNIQAGNTVLQNDILLEIE